MVKLLPETICKIVKILSMGELYSKVREIQYQGYSPPQFVRIENTPYYGVINGCPKDCKSLHHEVLCNNEEAIQRFLKENYPVRCTYIK